MPDMYDLFGIRIIINENIHTDEYPIIVKYTYTKPISNAIGNW